MCVCFVGVGFFFFIVLMYVEWFRSGTMENNLFNVIWVFGSNDFRIVIGIYQYAQEVVFHRATENGGGGGGGGCAFGFYFYLVIKNLTMHQKYWSLLYVLCQGIM